MNIKKQQDKLIKYAAKAEECKSRQEARKILKKVSKVACKLEVHRQHEDDNFNCT